MTKDEEFLQKFLEDDTTGHPFDVAAGAPSSLDAELAQKERTATAEIIKAEGEAEKATSNAAKEAAKREADRARKERDAIREQRRAERERRAESQQRVQSAKSLAGKISTATEPVVEPAKRAVDRLASVRTVGGIGLLLVILFILLFTVVQVNAAGDTRLKQFWYMLNGKARLQGRKTPEVPVNPTDYGKEFQNVGTALSKTEGDVATVIAQGVANTVTGGNGDIAAGIIAGIASDFGVSFRNLP